MKIELIIVDGKDVGYNLVAEDATEQEMLKRIQNLHFLADKKAKKIQYDGVSKNANGNADRLFFLQRQYALLPSDSELKRTMLRITLQKGA
ncbi:MAG: hypothetical protein LBQ74_20155 [Prevotella sp.]|jgi:hypothetical protein|nr:hypothetical protein [Prevotella sp.]